MAFEKYVIKIDKRQSRQHTDSDSIQLSSVKVGGSGGTEITGSNVVVSPVPPAKLDLTLSTGTTAKDILAVHSATNYTPTQVAAEGTTKISAHLKGIDLAIGSLASTIAWQPTAFLLTADADLNAATNGTTVTSLLPLSDDEAPVIVIGDFIAGQLLLSAGATDKVFEVYDDAGTLKVQLYGTQPVSGYTYITRNNLIHVTHEGTSMVHYNGTDFITIADFDFALATGVALSGSYAKAGSTTVEPVAGDSVEVAIGKLHAGALGDLAITTRVIDALAVTTAKIAADAIDNTKIADDAVKAENILLQNNTALRARNAADNANINLFFLSTANVVTMSSFWQTPSADPSNAYDVANKQYVTTQASAIKFRSLVATGWSNGTGTQAVKGNVGYLNADGTVHPAKADTTSIYKKRILVCADPTIDNTVAGNWLVVAGVLVGSASGGGTLTPGEEVYLSDSTAGNITQDISSIGSGHDIIAIGYATSASDWETMRPLYIERAA